MAFLMTLIAMFLTAGRSAENPWNEKAGAVVAAYENDPTREKLQAALDAAWRADDWETGLRLAAEARKRWPADAALRGFALRALWRGGEVEAAERLATEALPEPVPQPVLSTLIQIAGARGDEPAAEKVRATLERVGPASALDFYALAGAKLLDGPPKEVARLVTAAERALSAENGYPDTILADSLDGFAEFYGKIDDGKLNVVDALGEAPMPVYPMFGLPYCDVMVNGAGPFRMIIDTGGSILLSISPAAAEQAGLEPLAKASVRGAGGKEESWRTLTERVEIGGIRVRRVMTDVYDMPLPGDAIDGIIGTGLFARQRMVMDFKNAKLRVSPSSDAPGAGVELWTRILGDAKLVTRVDAGGAPQIALIDSGATVCGISPVFARKLHPDDAPSDVSLGGVGVGGDGPVGMRLGKSTALRIGERAFETVPMVEIDALDSLLSPVIGIQVRVLVGMTVLREAYTFTVDFGRTKMWVDWGA